MEYIKNKINYLYQHLFNSPKHPFFMDLERVNKAADNFINYQKKFIKEKIEYKLSEIPKELPIKEKKNKVLKKNLILNLNKELKKERNFNKIFTLITKISKNLIESTVKNENELYKNIKNSEKINVMIIGSGPIGLFLACYLDLYYNSGSLNNYPKVNVVLYDSRLEKSGFRKPYTRQRPFSTHSRYLSTVLPKIYCMNHNLDSLYINIFVLEYLLYTKALIEHKIPMIYENYNWDEYKNIINKGNFKVVFDCTGGRLETDIFNNINTDWMNNINKVDEKLNKQLLILPDKNIVNLIDYPKEKKFKKNHYYSSINTYDKDMNYKTKIDIDINDSDDLIFLGKLKNKYYNYKDIMIIIKNFKDDHNRNFLYNELLRENYKNKIFNFDTWGIYIRHTIQPAELINKNTIYIKAGDSIFHSHFITGAGLNRTISFAVKCANMISLIE
jgi:hypothetical protein